jgi:exosortase
MEANYRLVFMEDLLTISRRLTAHGLWFGIFFILSLLPFWRPLNALLHLSLHDDRYSHILLIPLMSVSLVYLRRERIFAFLRYCPSKSAPLLVVGVVLFCLAQSQFSALNPTDHLSIVVPAIVLVWMAGFALCFGMQSSRAALFPLLLLLLMIPIPTIALDKTVVALQEGSAVMTYALFKLLGVPVLWQRFKFSLPGVEIEIAKECSGIRSSLALFITSILAGYVFLQSNWRRVSFSLLTVPVVIFKNAVRIVTISCLGVYVNPGFFEGKLHRYGGLPFSLISLAILVPVLFALQNGETGTIEHPRSDEEETSGAGETPTPLSPRTETG